MTRRLTPERLAENTRFKNRLKASLRKHGYTQTTFAAQLGVSVTMVGYWCQGRYIPSLPRADQIAVLLDDDLIRTMVQELSIGRCAICPQTFTKTATRRLYCSKGCERDHRKGVVGEPKPDPRQWVIDQFCRGCEPEGFCRDNDCALRPFSPFVYIGRVA
jgi:transcriptional regulator with XRE-family HTH domain